MSCFPCSSRWHYDGARANMLSDRGLLLIQLLCVMRDASVSMPIAPKTRSRFTPSRLQSRDMRCMLRCATLATQQETSGSWKEDVQTTTRGNATPTHREAAVSCGQRLQWQDAIQLQEDMLRQHIEITGASMSSTVRACCFGMQWTLALQLLCKFPGTDSVLQAKLHGTSLNGSPTQHSDSDSVCTSVEDPQASVQDIVPPHGTNCAGQRWKDVLAILDVMKCQRILADSRACASAVEACMLCEQWTLALGLLLQVQDAQLSIEGMSAAGGRNFHSSRLLTVFRALHLEPNKGIYHAAILACLERADWKQAVRFVREAERLELELDAISYSKAIRACADAYEWGAAMRLFKSMKLHGVTPDAETYNSVLAACNLKRKWQWALILLRHMDDANLDVSLEAYGHALQACRYIEWRVAVLLLADMNYKRRKPTSAEYLPVLRVCEMQQQWRHVLQLFTEMEKAHVAVDCQSYDSLISAFLDGERFELAVQVVEESCGHGCELQERTVCNAVEQTCSVHPSLPIPPTVLRWSSYNPDSEKGRESLGMP